MQQAEWRRFSRLLVLVCILGGLLLAATPQSNYILQGTPAVNITGLAAKYQFTVLKSFIHPPTAAYSISFASPPSAQTIKQLSQEPGVKEVEANVTVDSAESDSHSKAVAQLQSLGNL